MPGETHAVFEVLADTTRRQLLDQLSRDGPSTATQLARAYPISRQAVAKHLSLLADAGLVVSERRGREVRYLVHKTSLDGAASWLAEVGERWDRRLAGLLEQLGEQDT